MQKRPSRKLKVLSKRMHKTRTILLTAAMMAAVVVCRCPAARIAAGDKLPTVTAQTVSGQPYQRQAGTQRVAMIAFLNGGQKPSRQAAADLLQVAPSFGEHQSELDVVIVTDVQEFQKEFAKPQGVFTVVQDTDKQLWGQFHIIAAPTVIVADKTDKVTAVIAGHGYDFAQSVRFHLNEALGIEQEMTAEDVGKVKTVQNKTSAARLQRHLKMAKMLQDKGKTAAAMEQLEKARQIDPNDLQLAIQIGIFHCKGNQPQKALDTVRDLEPSLPKDIAEVQLIIGWANRLSGDLAAAQKSLLAATVADPNSARAFFELGQVYEATSQNTLALKAYKKALSILLDAK